MNHSNNYITWIFQPIVDAANAIHDNQALKIPADISLNKFLREVGPGYYTYDGSLTTPSCNEVVSWHVMEGTITISQEQVPFFYLLNIFLPFILLRGSHMISTQK